MKFCVEITVSDNDFTYHHCHHKKHFNFKIGIPKQKKEVSKMIEVGLLNTQKVKVTLTPVIDLGNGKTIPAKVDGAPQWSVASGDSTVIPAADGMSAYIVSSDVPGDSDIRAKADADVGEGVEEIEAIIIVHVEGAKASSLGVSVGPAEPK